MFYIFVLRISRLGNGWINLLFFGISKFLQPIFGYDNQQERIVNAPDDQLVYLWLSLSYFFDIKHHLWTAA